MKSLRIKDNAWEKKDSFTNIESLKGKIADKTLEQLWTDYLQPLLREYVQGMYDEEGLMNRFAKAYGYQKPAEGDTDEIAQDQG